MSFLVQIEGQDSLEVRQVHLGNGQVASLILEEGRLQRIVSSNGQIAELQWQPPPAQVRSQVPKQQLAVKMHRGVSPYAPTNPHKDQEPAETLYNKNKPGIQIHNHCSETFFVL